MKITGERNDRLIEVVNAETNFLVQSGAIGRHAHRIANGAIGEGRTLQIEVEMVVRVIRNQVHANALDRTDVVDVVRRDGQP